MCKVDYYSEAKRYAMKSTLRKRYGCVIIHRNKIVGQGYNYDIGIHSQRKQCVL